MLAFSQLTGNDVSGPFFRRYFLLAQAAALQSVAVKAVGWQIAIQVAISNQKLPIANCILLTIIGKLHIADGQ